MWPRQNPDTEVRQAATVFTPPPPPAEVVPAEPELDENGEPVPAGSLFQYDDQGRFKGAWSYTDTGDEYVVTHVPTGDTFRVHEWNDIAIVGNQLHPA